jgi:hypothetical protein
MATEGSLWARAESWLTWTFVTEREAVRATGEATAAVNDAMPESPTRRVSRRTLKRDAMMREMITMLQLMCDSHDLGV